MSQNLSRMAAKSPIMLGVVNPGPDWHPLYNAAMNRLQDRIRVAAITDDVPIRARQLAESLNARPVFGLRRLLRDPDVATLALLDPGWRRDWLLTSAAESARPLLIAHPDRFSEDALRKASEVADVQGTILMPLLPLRWTPVTIRLRELLATRLGPVQDVRLHVTRLCRCLENLTATPMEAFDWFRSLVTTSTCEVELQPADSRNGENARVVAVVRKGRGTTPDIECEFVWSGIDEVSEASGAADQLAFCHITCRGGSASLLAKDQLVWETSGKRQTENLAGDRSAIEVGFDLFARRVVGGLIPVPSLDEVGRALEWAAAVDEVRRTRRPRQIPARRDARG